jgi:hypothetical protein
MKSMLEYKWGYAIAVAMAVGIPAYMVVAVLLGLAGY